MTPKTKAYAPINSTSPSPVIPATGAIARTATNIKNGGRTPMAGMIHAVVLLIILMTAGPLASQIPLAVLAGILMVVAYHMSEWRSVRSVFSGNMRDVIVLLTTFFLTVFVDLTVAVSAGLVISFFLSWIKWPKGQIG